MEAGTVSVLVLNSVSVTVLVSVAVDPPPPVKVEAKPRLAVIVEVYFFLLSILVLRHLLLIGVCRRNPHLRQGLCSKRARRRISFRATYVIDLVI